MSQLKVLIYGNHPNLALYAWRFQLAKSVDLYHVSNSGNSDFEVETHSYGSDRFRLENHFQRLGELKMAVESSSEKFDLVILSSSSLQEISSIVNELNSMIMTNTKIFIESTGFIQLESFIKMSVEFPQVKVFSLMSDYDIRQVSENRFVQFNNGQTKQTIFIGESGSKNSSVQSSYQKPVTNLLTTFHSLFLKLFPKDDVDTCNFSPLEFLTQQWKLAIPRICFDPLLIIFEQFKPNQLPQQILAKPLISGLVTEIITLTRTMGVKLPSGFDNENDLLNKWIKDNGNDKPSLLYHYINKTAPLDIDMLLLQPILLADDFTIKTPYLEFLYSMMCQFQKLNNNQSKLFARADNINDLKNELNQLSLLKDSFTEKEKEFASKIAQTKNTYQNQVISLQQELASLRENLQQEQSKSKTLRRDLKSAETEISLLKEQQMTSNNPPRTPVDSAPININLPNGSDQSHPQEYTETGTPLLRDIEDIAIYGIAYNDPPADDKKTEKIAESTTILTDGSQSGSQPKYPVPDDHSLRERELELRRKELELQERELELNRKKSQPMLNQKFSQGQIKAHAQQPEHLNQHPGQSQARKPHGQHQPPVNKMQGIPGQYGVQYPPVNHQQQPQHRPHLSGALQTGPAAPGPQRPLYGVGVSQTMLDGALPQNNNYGQKQFQKTSRKNRRSNMPMLRNPSNTMLNNFSIPPSSSGFSGQPQPHQPRFNSLSGNAPSLSMHYQNGSLPRLNSNPIRVSSQGQLQTQQQNSPTFASGVRQTSSSTMMDEGFSVASVIQRPPQMQQDLPVTLDSPKSESLPTLESDISSVNQPFSEPNVSPEIEDSPLPDSRESKETKKSKFSFFHSKKK